MSDSFRSTQPNQWTGNNNGNQQPANDNSIEGSEVGKAALFGLLGGIVSAVGYLIYRRLPDEQKERLHDQVKTVVAAKISEVRANFNI